VGTCGAEDDFLRWYLISHNQYQVINVVSAYNLLLGRPSLNKLGAVASTRHMNMKFPPSNEGDHHQV